MSKPRGVEGGVNRNDAVDSDTSSARGTAWDPLASIQKTISPTQRMQLLKMEVPVLPPEDFMDTTELERGRHEHTRRFVPLVLCLGGALLILLSVGVWLRVRSSPSSSAQVTRATPTAQPRPAAASTPFAPPTENTGKATLHAASPSQPNAERRLANAASTLPSQAGEPIGTGTPGKPTAPPNLPKSRGESKQSTVNRPNVAEAAEPKAPSAPTPQPASSGIVFWTQPR